jgi:hypothetical protein
VTFSNVMAARFEDQPWHQEWREVLDRVIAAEMARDRAKPGTPEREAADREYEAALVVFRALADKISHKPPEWWPPRCRLRVGSGR